MAYPNVLYGPEGEQFNVYAAGTAGFDTRGGRYPLGTQLILQDGRKFRFAEAGASTLVSGNALTGIVGLSTDADMVPAAGAIGDRLVTFTHGSATVVANFFSEGFLTISVTPGGGDIYRIGGHLALTSSTAGDIINLAPGNALRQAISATSRIHLTVNPYGRVIQAPATTVAAVPVGVAISAPTTGKFCYVQTCGPAGVLTSGTAIAGDVVGAGLGTAGAVGPIAALATQPIFGTVIRAAASGAWSTIRLSIDG